MKLEKRTYIVRATEDRRKFHSIKYFLNGGVERRVFERRRVNRPVRPEVREVL